MNASVPPPSILLTLLAFFASPGFPRAEPAAGPPASGRVFLDTNGNGTFDAGERGVAGCLVSDEHSFARSDGEGRYQLQLSGLPAVVFAVNPPGTWPAGRWWTFLAEDGAGAVVDFPLQSQDQSGPLYFAHGTDPHLQDKAAPLYRRYLEHVNALPVPVRFVVHTGDLVIDSAMATLERARELFSLYEAESKALQPPLRNLMGNHDIAGVLNPKLTGAEPGFGKALYRQRFGPATYAFRYGPYHFIAMDGTMIQERKLVYGLTPESADWAIRYLEEEVAEDHRVILLIHEPLFPEIGGVRQPDTPETRPHEARLLAALQGRKPVMTLAGHAHSRTQSTWAGAPHLLGGAISYAWHGLLPYPPAPCSYVLFRLEDGRAEHVYLDWAEERSIDIAAPAFTGLVRGRQPVRGVVADFNAGITLVQCALGGKMAPATISRRNSLATAFETELDTAELADGVYDLLVTATGKGNRTWTECQPVVVLNGNPAGFAAAGGATLSFRVEGAPAPGLQVSCNGHPLTPAAGKPGEVRCAVSAAQLRRLNEIVIRGQPSPGPGKPAVIRSVTLDYQGGVCRDIRYAPGSRRPLTAEVVAFIDLDYHEEPGVSGPAPRPAAR